MARIAGVNIPQNKLVHVGLTYIYGIGNKFSQQICTELDIPKSKRVNELTDDQILKIREYIDQKFTVEGDLRRETSLSIKRLIDLATYRGSRHRKKLPVRGQRTRCNSRTRKGKAIAIAGKKLTPLKNNEKEAENKEQNIESKIKKSSYSKKKKEKNILNGIAYVQSTFNNTIVSIADTNGNVVSWASAGQKGFKGSRKSTPYAAQIAADAAAAKALEVGMKILSVEVKGPGSGRETALRALQARGFKITSIKDTTPMPHNGTRPPKKESLMEQLKQFKNWKSLIKPTKLDVQLSEDKTFAKITAEPLEKGYGLTLGNS